MKAFCVVTFLLIGVGLETVSFVLSDVCTVKTEGANLLSLSSLFFDKPVRDVAGENKIIHLSLCKNEDINAKQASFSPPCSANASICSTTTINGTELLVWEMHVDVQPVVKKDGGHLALQYESLTPCSKSGVTQNSYYKLELILSCPDEKKADSSPIWLATSTTCTHRVLWPTELACPEPVSDTLGDVVGSDCRVTDPTLGHTFDLCGLANVIQAQTDRGIYKVSVCQKSSDCGLNIGGCLVGNNSGLGNSSSYGVYNEKLISRNGTLLLMYNSGDNCDSDNKTTRSTMIQFICDRQVQSTGPENAKMALETPGCQAHFYWKTEKACAPWKNISCLATDSNGHRYDLSPLAASNYNHVTADGTYILNVCHTIVYSNGAQCPSSSASCVRSQGDRYRNIGSLEESPAFGSSKNLNLKYTEGDVCPEDVGRRLSTIIDFHCDSNLEISEPQFVEYRDCTYYFFWKTASACPLSKEVPNEVTCHIDTKHGHVNLTGLARQRVDHGVTADDMPGSRFLLNVCRPVVSQTDGCGSAAVCLLTAGNKHAVPLGKAVHLPVSNGDEIDLLYSNGAVCEKDASYNYSSRIRFQCDEKAGIGRPSLLNHTHDCQFIFVWPTSSACPKKSEVRPVPSHCIFEDPFFDKPVDLSPLKSIPRFLGSGVCSSPWKNATFQAQHETITIRYQTDEACNSGGKGRGEFLVSCDRDAITPELRPTEDYPCLRIFEIKTSLACDAQVSSLEETTGDSPVTPIGTGSAISWLVGVIVIGAVLALTYTKRKAIAVIFKRMKARGHRGLSREDRGIRYSEVPSNNEDLPISFGPVDSRNLHDDSDDELIGV